MPNLLRFGPATSKSRCQYAIAVLKHRTRWLCVGIGLLRESRFKHWLIGFMQMIPLILPGLRHMGKILGRKKPLPDKFFGSVWIFFVQMQTQEKPQHIFLARSRRCNSLTVSSWVLSSGRRTVGRSTVLSFFPFPSWMVIFPASKFKHWTRRLRHSNKRKPQP